MTVSTVIVNAVMAYLFSFKCAPFSPKGSLGNPDRKLVTHMRRGMLCQTPCVHGLLSASSLLGEVYVVLRLDECGRKIA